MYKVTNCRGDVVVLILIWIVLGSDGLNQVTLEAPNYVRRGENLKLECHYDTTPEESIYAVKWYRGSEEFYRFLPKEVPPQQSFFISGSGIVVDMNRSSEATVEIRQVTDETKGRYKCVVSIENTFQTMFDQKEVNVVVIGYDAPKLSLEKLSYHPGEIGRANCTLEKSWPRVNITWLLNDKQVDPSQVVTRTVEDLKDPLLTSTYSTLIFNVSNSYSPMQIKCRGELYDLYSEVSVIKLQPKPPAYSSYGGVSDPLLRSNNTFLRSSGVGRKPGESHLSHLLTAQVFFFLLSLYTCLRLGDT